MLYAACTEVTSWWYTCLFETVEDSIPETNKGKGNKVCILLVFPTYILHDERFRKCKVMYIILCPVITLYLRIFVSTALRKKELPCTKRNELRCDDVSLGEKFPACRRTMLPSWGYSSPTTDWSWRWRHYDPFEMPGTTESKVNRHMPEDTTL
jgi:hypothetical protein